MVSKENLRNILLLRDLPDSFLDTILPSVRREGLDRGAVVFEEGSKAEDFYMLLRGKILLEVEVSSSIIIALGSIKSGYSFGWSSLLDGGIHSSYAIAAEPCEVLSIPGTRFMRALDQDKISGFLVMTRVFHIFRRRLERRTNQFLKVMQKHPDIQQLLGL
jgi:CRP-like cAMP-binding protein